MNRRAFANRLDADETAGFAVPGRLTAACRRLHRSRRGNVSVLFVFLALGLFCAAAMVWNTGETIAARVELQTAADSAAYSSAMWNTRAVNNITGTNMLILRNASAFAASIDSIVTAIAIPVNWIRWADQRAKACGPYYGACFAALMAYVLATEGPEYWEFVSSAVPEAIEGLGDFPNRLESLFAYEKAWVEAIPRIVEEQREALETYYDCEIRLARPGLDGRVEPPLVQGSFMTILTPLAIRFFLTDNGWPKDSDFQDITIGKAKKMWYGAGVIAVLIAAAVVGDEHYVLPTMRGGFLEKGPKTLEEWKAFTVVAGARRPDTTRGRYVASGVFDDPVVPRDAMLAFAQAETYNGIDGRLSKLSLGGLEALFEWYPFRVWTTWGWQWQARLALGDQLESTLASDAQLRRWFGDLKINASTTDGWETLDDLILH